MHQLKCVEGQTLVHGPASLRSYSKQDINVTKETIHHPPSFFLLFLSFVIP